MEKGKTRVGRKRKGLEPECLNGGVNRWGEGLRVLTERVRGTVLERESWVEKMQG